jgi:hypothetical protein
MKFAGTLAAGLLLGAAPAFAQSVPKERSEIAYPGRAEPLGERVLATSRQQRRRKLRLEAERGHPLLPDHRQKHHLPAGRRAPDRQLSAHKGIPWRADNPKGSGCSVIGLGVDKDGNFLFGDWCSGRLLGNGLGQIGEQVADAGADPNAVTIHWLERRRGRFGAGDDLLLLLHRRQGRDKQSARRFVARHGDGQGPGRRRNGKDAKGGEQLTFLS